MRGPRHPGSMDCRAVYRLLQCYLDGELGDPGAVLVAEHLAACLGCDMGADVYRWLKDAAAGLARAEDPQQLDRLERFADALAEGHRT